MIEKTKKINVPLYGEVFKLIDASENAEYYIFDQKSYERVKHVSEGLDELKEKHKNLQEKYNNLHKAYQNYKEYVDANKADIEEKKAARDEAVQHLKQLEEENEAIKKTKQEIIDLARERANKERKIKDKKNSPGYVIMSTEQYFYSTSKTQGFWMWKTIMQTPFFSDLNYDAMSDMWDEDDVRYEYFKEIKIGKKLTLDGSNDYYTITETKKKTTTEFWVNVNFKRNFKTGFWEATVIHNEEVII